MNWNLDRDEWKIDSIMLSLTGVPLYIKQKFILCVNQFISVESSIGLGSQFNMENI